MDIEKIKQKYNLEKVTAEKEDLEKEMSTAHLSVNKDISKLSAQLSYTTKIYQLIKDLYNKISGLEQAEEIIKSETDKEFVNIAVSERSELETKISELDETLRKEIFLHEFEDPDDQKSIILEIRAGAGGEEASLFAGDLFRMYTQYANKQGWTINIMDSSGSESGGFKEVVAQISGKNAYKMLKYESGVHRVQRIPSTESSGRIHTSTVSVAVLPEAKDIDIQIDPSDIRVDVMRASGAGGQCVNRTDSAVRITHLETGIVVSCQETKHQQQNKEKAMALLRSRLYDKKKAEEHAKRDSLRHSQIGSAMRAEKIRTYNFPQSRITDHRIKKSWFNIEGIMNGELEEIIEDIDKSMIDLQLQSLNND